MSKISLSLSLSLSLFFTYHYYLPSTTCFFQVSLLSDHGSARCAYRCDGLRCVGGFAHGQSGGLLQVSNNSRRWWWSSEACSRTRTDLLQTMPRPVVERLQRLAEYWIRLCIRNVTWIVGETSISMCMVAYLWFSCYFL